MESIDMQEDTSAFFNSPQEASLNSSLCLIHRSEKGCSEIWRADRMGRFRALKCLKEEYRGNRLYEDLLRKEFEIGYSLRHPGIVEFYGFVEEPELGHCIEMEWVDGSTLDALRQDKPLDRKLKDGILDEICDALSYLHMRGVVYRDLKPSNIMLTHDGHHVRLIDFGFSDSAGHSILKASAGTVSFAAPEVLAGSTADARSDIYSLGLVIGSLSDRHKAVVRKCCESNPQARYASVAEVKEALHRRKRIWPWLLAAVVAVGIVIAALWPGQSGNTMQKQSLQPAADTLIIQPASISELEVAAPSVAPKVQDAPKAQNTPADKTPPAQKAKTKDAAADKEVKVDTTLIDDLFRQATDLFED